MRLGLLVLVGALTGCIQGPEDDGGYYGGDSGWGSGWGGGGGPIVAGCQSDTECGGMVCARTGECLAASQVRIVHTDWTLRGKTASTATCSAVPNLSITFSSSGGEEYGYAPVPCSAGRHTVDKMPIRFTTVQLARDGDYSGGDSGTFDAQGNALLDLPY